MASGVHLKDDDKSLNVNPTAPKLLQNCQNHMDRIMDQLFPLRCTTTARPDILRTTTFGCIYFFPRACHIIGTLKYSCSAAVAILPAIPDGQLHRLLGTAS